MPSLLSWSSLIGDHYVVELVFLLALLLFIGYRLFWTDPGGSNVNVASSAPTSGSGPTSESGPTPDPVPAREAPVEPAGREDPPTEEPEPGVREDAVLGQVYDERPEEVDDLTRISGVGPVLRDKLNDFGVYRFEQIAHWDPAVIAAFSERLSFKGRVEREDWVGQAKTLSEGKA